MVSLENPTKRPWIQVSHIVDKPQAQKGKKNNLLNWVWSTTYASCTTIRWPCSRRISCKMGMNSGQYPLSSSSTSFTVNFLRRPGYITKEKKFLKQKYLILLMNFVCESVYELTSRLTLLSLRCATTFLQNLIKDMADSLYSTIFFCFSDKFPVWL